MFTFIYVPIFLLHKKIVAVSSAMYRDFSFTYHHGSTYEHCLNRSNFAIVFFGIPYLCLCALGSTKEFRHIITKNFGIELSGTFWQLMTGRHAEKMYLLGLIFVTLCLPPIFSTFEAFCNFYE